ncbi:MAG: response regulator [Clostridia bacterium]|nr:response regulator [Clostridia bacterium]
MIRTIICDDEQAALKIIRHFIEMMNLPIEIIGTAENGVDALELIRKEKPDLAFMDINMPFMNGFEVIREAGDTKIIVITAIDSFEYAQTALRLGVCDIIAKPIDFDQLKAAVEKAVGQRFTGNQVVDKALAWLHEHYREKVELPELAKITLCNESYLARIFKKETGSTIINYVHKLRIEQGIRLMEEDLSVAEIAEEVGYNNLNQFYKYFEQYTGQTPAAYRKRRNNND